MKKYNKLVRDKIPEIIENNGQVPKSHILSDEDYNVELDKKLLEEVYEYQADKSLEELADILEVLYAICNARGYTIKELEEKRKEKYIERGGFENKIFLESVEDSSPKTKVGTVSDIKAIKKWNKLSQDSKERFLNNVYCRACGETTIVDYSITNDKYGIVLKGTCIKCSGVVVRVIEGLE